jgi:parallel beta-helix repeat protein
MMRNRVRNWIGFSLIGFFALFLPHWAYAGTTYYVDFLSGNDGNKGTSVSTPWKHCPGDPSATNTAASTTFSAGDTVIFKGGIPYYGQIAISSSGSSDSVRVTYDGNSAGTWGTGKAIIDGGVTARGLGFYSTASLSYVTIKNFEIRNINKGNDGIGIYLRDANHSFTNTKVIVQDNYIHDIGYWNNDGNPYPAGSGISLCKPTNCIVTGNEVTKTALGGIGFGGGSNSVIENNTIHSYIRWGIDIASDIGTATDHIIRGNTIYDLYYYDASYYGGSGDPPHTDFIFVRGDYGSSGWGHGVPERIIIERNLFYNNAVFAQYSEGSGMINLSETLDTVIRNNVFINGHAAAVAGEYSVGTYLYNNTCYSSTQCFGFGTLEGHIGTGQTILKNNLMVTGHNTYGMSFGSANAKYYIVADNNYYVDGTKVNVIDFPGINTSLPQWQAQGFDTHPGGWGNGTALISTVKFVSTSGFPTACQTMDLRLQAGSPLIGAGANLSSTGFTTDKNGVSRPQGSGWTIGAYEGTGTGLPPPVPPANPKTLP